MNQEAKEKSVTELAAYVGGRVIGDDSVLIKRVADLERAEAGDIAFIENAKLLLDTRFVEKVAMTRASCLIVPADVQINARCAIEAAHPKLAFAKIARILHQPKTHTAGRHPTVVVADSAQIDESAYLGAYVQIGERVQIGAGAQIHAGAIISDDVRIGRGCVIHPRVVLYNGVTLGEAVTLHAGVIIGADGFGYVRDQGDAGYVKFPQVGTVVIEDEVEIGANSCVDRGALGETRIGRGSKIDNLVQIGHNVRIGARVVIAAQTGISGSTVIEDDAVIGGQVGFGDHAKVERGAVIGSKAGVLPGKIVRAGVWWGVPVQPLDEYKRLHAHLGRLPQLRDEVRELSRQVKELRARLDENSSPDEMS
jgi:UDP-3-O-[3-hydroxymyristoyl] glucosamine N-acyltransferase